MAVAHLLAAVACGWWLARGERALWHLVALAGRGWTELLAPLLLAWARGSRAVLLHLAWSSPRSRGGCRGRAPRR